MNGKFSKIKRVLTVLVCVSMLLSCTSFGAVAAEISSEAVVFISPELEEPVANQVGMNFVEVEAGVINHNPNQKITDQPVIARMYDGSSLLSLAYAPVRGESVFLELGVPDSVPTGTYTIELALSKAEELAYCEIFYIGVEEVENFLKAINLSEAESSEVRDLLDKNYNALSVIEFDKNDDGDIILKLTGDDYTNLSKDAKDVFAELILNGVNGKYSGGKGAYAAENCEDFVKEAYILAAYNAEGITDANLANLIYKFSSVVGFDAEDKTLYGKIEEKDVLAKVVKTMLPETESVTALAETLEDAATVQIVNEAYWGDLVEVVAERNDLFEVDESQIKRLQAIKSLKNEFCKAFDDTYYSVEEIQDAWDDAYKVAVKEYNSNQSSGGNGSGSGKDTSKGNKGTIGANVNLVSTQITDSENNKDPNVEIKDYYTDVAGTGYEWTSDAILNLTKASIISGYGDKTFKPANSVTRAEFMKMVVNVFGLADISAVSTFGDVDKNAWYHIYVASAEKLGIAQGYGNGLFGVNDPVTRQDAITIIYRAAKIKNLSVDKFSASAINLVDKGTIAPYALEAVEALYNTGVYLDASDPKAVNMFEPTRNASRAYLAVILNQIYNFIK